MTGKTILLVDDDPTAHATIEALLAKDDAALIRALGADEAFAHLSRTSVDLILCDVMMPGVDGFEVCRRIKAHPTWRSIPVILVTALDADDDLVRGLEAGADEFVSKPVNRVVLRARVRAMLRIREQYTEIMQRSSPDLETLLKERRESLAKGGGLSPREREVLDLLLLGRSHDEIGTALGITARTAKFDSLVRTPFSQNYPP